MSTKATSPELLDWLNTQLERKRVSGAEASVGAGLNIGAISEIINGRTPGLKVCIALAEYFGVAPEHVLRLAGHLPPRPATPLAEVPRLGTFLDKLARLDRDAQNRIMDTALMLLEIDEAAREEAPAQTDVLR